MQTGILGLTSMETSKPSTLEVSTASRWRTIITLSVGYISGCNPVLCRSQWPPGLRRRSAAARLLRLWVRIPPGAWMSVVSVVFCQVEISVTS